MTDVSDVRAEVLNFREEARGCLQLAQAEAIPEVRTVLVGMAIGWLKLANGNPRPTFCPSLTDDRDDRDEEERRFEAFSGVRGCSTSVPGMSDYYTMMAKAVGALDPNTGDARLPLYERARAALVAELRGADPALDPSDIMAAQMLLELAIGEVEADAQRDQRALQTMDAPSMAWPPDTELGREPETVHSRDFAPGSSTELVTKPEAAEYCEDPRPDRIGRRPW
jgi:hypothetical protein